VPHYCIRLQQHGGEGEGEGGGGRKRRVDSHNAQRPAVPLRVACRDEIRAYLRETTRKIVALVLSAKRGEGERKGGRG